MTDTFYVWWNSDNGAIIQRENSRYDYDGVFYNKKAAREFMQEQIENGFISTHDGLSHLMLRETTLPENPITGDDVLGEMEQEE